MTTPVAMAAAYLKQFTAHGETVTLSNGTDTTSTLGRLFYPKAEGVTDSVERSECRAVILTGLDFPPERGHTLTAGGKSWVITFVDDMSRRVAGVTVAYNLTLAG